MQIRSRIVAREFRTGDRSDLYAGTHPLEALKALMHVDVSRAFFPCQGSETCASEIAC